MQLGISSEFIDSELAKMEQVDKIKASIYASHMSGHKVKFYAKYTCPYVD